jgi:hypothetical protein
MRQSGLCFIDLWKLEIRNALCLDFEEPDTVTENDRGEFLIEAS